MSSKRAREESSEEDYELGTKRLRTLPPENRIVESKLNEGKSSAILDFYAFGANDNLQLGEFEDVQSAEAVYMGKVSDLNCLSYVAGKDNSYVMEVNKIAKYRNVYSWGGDVEGLGREMDDEEKGPVSIETLAEQPMVQIAAGSNHVVGLTSTGEVISWGTYKDPKGEVVGFKSHMPKDEWQEIPDVIEELEEVKIIQVAASRSRSIALSETGEVYEWGETRMDNKILERHRQDSLTPSNILIPGKIVAIYAEANGDTVFAEDSTGAVYSWGNNNYYQCGIDNLVVPSKKVKDPKVAKSNAIAKRKKLATHSRPAKAKQINDVLKDEGETVKKISSGRLHTVMLTDEGNVYTWGNNKLGQLGQGLGPKKEVAVPTKITFSGMKGKIIDIASGPFHTICVTSKGEVFGFGGNKNGCLGELSDEQNTPAKITLDFTKGGQAVGVTCGSKHNLLAVSRK